MLVRFLSFVASTLATARYKAILLSCLVLIVSLGSIAGVALWQGSRTPPASKIEQTTDAKDDSRQKSLQLRDKDKQAIADGDTPTADQSQTNTTPPPANGSTTPAQPPTEPAEPTNTIRLSTAKISIAAGASSEAITASLVSSETTDLRWEITLDERAGTILSENTNNTSTSFKVQVKSDASKQQYELVVKARDAQNTVISAKSIIVTVL